VSRVSSDVKPVSDTSAKVTDAATGVVNSTTTFVPTGVFDGGGAATLQLWLAGVSSTLPEPSMARTSSV
jgi:hypothetical protein